jgi:hypothetical protein
MKFIKNKKRFAIFAFLVSFGFSVSNVCAMDPETAAAAAPAAGNLGEVAAAAGSGALASVLKVEQDVPNLCKGFFEALNEGKPEEAKSILVNFYLKIPSVLKKSTRGFPPGTKFEEKQEAIKKDSFKYHMSLFYVLAMCIANACTEDIQDFSKVASNIHRLNSFISVENGGEYAANIKLIVKAKTGLFYLIIFEIAEGDGAESGTLKFYIKIEKYEIKSKVRFVNISAGYRPMDNFFKNTTTLLVPSSSEGRDLSNVPTLDPEISPKPKVTQVENIQKRLYLIFKAIPFEYRVHIEQYSQLILSSLINFMGSYICNIECPAGDGRADLIIKTQREGSLAVCIIELKRGGSADKPVMQIKRNMYLRYFSVGATVKIMGLSIMTSEERDVVKIECNIEDVIVGRHHDDSITFYIPENDPSASAASASDAPAATSSSSPVVKKSHKRPRSGSDSQKSDG